MRSISSTPVRPDVFDELTQSMDLVRNFDVCSAHRGHRIAASEEASEYRIQLVFFGFFVRLDLLDQHAVDAPYLLQSSVGIERPQRIGNLVEATDVAPDGEVLLLESLGQ